ncbi:MAG: hypothetical protein HY074_15785 [Deltaproteobacteria bacterium]|nr:hypothetical protein [Deltaproteobacteria bacterium]
MIRLGMLGLKMLVLSAVVLIIGQIHVGHQRICDHVRDLVQHTHIQRPVHWIAERVNFLGGNGNMSKTGHAEIQVSSRVTGSEHSDSDKNRLSGLLKHTRH